AIAPLLREAATRLRGARLQIYALSPYGHAARSRSRSVSPWDSVCALCLRARCFVSPTETVRVRS
ncbi:hypothetical protein, partial [Brasilonema octagenarum]|uniref:hypothetical protein n=1 Tax=Brasilonema octagenarum TaxID=417105 RepID=UPI001B7D03F5